MQPTRGGRDMMTALSAETGEVLWTAPHPPSGYASSEDLFVIDGVVWCGETTSGHAVGHYAGHDVRTGKIVKEFDPDVKVLLMSGYSINGKASKILERGCDGFIQKPFRMEALSRIIRVILEGRVDPKSKDPGPEDPALVHP